MPYDMSSCCTCRCRKYKTSSPSTPRARQAGTRILYWVRGNYRVRDNLALSVAMWLSTELRMPLQASVRQRDVARPLAVQMLYYRHTWCVGAVDIEPTSKSGNEPWTALRCAKNMPARGSSLQLLVRALPQHCSIAAALQQQHYSSSSSSIFPSVCITYPPIVSCCPFRIPL